jgi:hypothetical protein
MSQPRPASTTSLTPLALGRSALSALLTATGFAGFAAIALAGCKDQAKVSAARAAENAVQLGALVDKDLGEVERGLPAGAKKLGPLVANGADPSKDVAGVRHALGKVRREVPDLDIAKSTFFALADANGVAIRNDLEEDVMAGQNLITIFPELAKAKDGYVTTTGKFPGQPPKQGPDEDWMAGAPVKREDGTTGAIFVTGWTYRFFARHLQESLKDRLADEAKSGQHDGKVPVFYVAVFDKTGVFTAPLTPEVDAKALTEQDLVSKTASGPAQGTLNLTDRSFGWAALRTPKMAPDTGIVVLRSET